MRRTRKAKLSKAQKLDNDTNKWLAKKAAAIDMLVKAMEHLKSLDRSHRRLQKAALHPVQQKIADKLNAATKPRVETTPATQVESPLGPTGPTGPQCLGAVGVPVIPAVKKARKPKPNGDAVKPAAELPPPDAVHKRMIAAGFRPTKKSRQPTG
jgi:hypothetical protein